MTLDELLAQTQMSREDFLELIAFERKVEFEGLSYATENYAPRFTDPHLAESALSIDAMNDLLSITHDRIDQFWTQVDNAGRLLDEHIDAQQAATQNDLTGAVPTVPDYARNRDDRVAAGQNPGGDDPALNAIDWDDVDPTATTDGLAESYTPPEHP